MSQKYFKLILACILGLLFQTQQLWANVVSNSTAHTPQSFCVDSIMNNVYFYAPFYKTAITEYDADLYIKTKLNILRKNLFIRYLPSMFRPKHGMRKYIIETYNDLHYKAPDIYDQKIKAITGTTPKLKGASGNVLKYFHINIYSDALIKDKLISPLSRHARKYYNYEIERIDKGVGGHLEFTIKFTPKNKSFQLVRGHMIVSDKVWSIREIHFFGRTEYISVNWRIQMGEVGRPDEFLPKNYHIDATIRFLWNKIKGSYEAVMRYDDIKQKELCELKPKNRNYDLTEYYSLQYQDTVNKKERDFDKYRMLPLRSSEEQLYEEFYKLSDSLEIKKLDQTSQKKSTAFWGELGDFLLNKNTLNLYEVGTIRFSPIINPFLFSYSGKDGLRYKHKIKYNRLFRGDRVLRVTPTFGYNFKWREFYWKVHSDFNYWPQKRTGIELNVGRGNRIYSSEVLDDLKGQTDTINFNQFNLNYFKNLYVDFMHTWEVSNGLNVDIGISGNKRESPKSSLPDTIANQVEERFKGRYVSVAPRVRISWTPGQYYYMNGKRKINLHSEYPTFTIDWERSIKGFLSATGAHERLEVDVQHKIPLSMMRTFYYRLGGGKFTNQEQIYFVDFVYFAKNNLPEGWNDDIGGTFQILDRRWYNASQWYLRGNMVYEAPFLLLPHIRKYTRSVINERIYINALLMNQMHPYIELGYGIGTHIFDLGLFVSNANWKNTSLGFKITFELFNR